MKIEFVSYDGGFPCLCSGILTLKIDGRAVKFGGNYGKQFWESGGYLDENYEPVDGDWIINERDLPKELRPYAGIIEEIFNENVPCGCCGGFA